jgi:hypothetical protein
MKRSELKVLLETLPIGTRIVFQSITSPKLRAGNPFVDLKADTVIEGSYAKKIEANELLWVTDIIRHVQYTDQGVQIPSAEVDKWRYESGQQTTRCFALRSLVTFSTEKGTGQSLKVEDG